MNFFRFFKFLSIFALLLHGLPLEAEQIFPRLTDTFPQPLSVYEEVEAKLAKETGHPLSIMATLLLRIHENPLNLAVTLLFFCAILHTFMVARVKKFAHHLEARLQRLDSVPKNRRHNIKISRSLLAFWAQIFGFLGEVEAVFGIWLFPVALVITLNYDWATFANYVGHRVQYTEPMFVVVIMTMASSKPIIRFAEKLMGGIAAIGRHSVTSWWLTILIVAPMLGSFITEPAAMTIAAVLIAEKFYDLHPSKKFAYATIGVLFANVSIGGVLTHFAAPPVLVVVSKWDWTLPFMMKTFGWKSIIAILLTTATYAIIFRKELCQLQKVAIGKSKSENLQTKANEERIPWIVTFTHMVFIGWVVMNLHTPPIFWFSFLLFLAFMKATEEYQFPARLREPLLVGFFLAGLITHGGLQQWWIAPVLDGLKPLQLFFGASFLSSFNDNASITYLTSLVPAFMDNHALQYAVMAGAISFGGLTVIANAPNPAGQSILQKYFGKNGVSPLYLFLGAILPSVLISACFLLL